MAASPHNKIYFYAFLVLITLLSLYILWPMKDVILIAWIIITLFMPVYTFFNIKLKLHQAWASFLSMIAVILTILFPVTILINLTITQFQVFYSDIQVLSGGKTAISSSLEGLFDRANHFFSKIPYVNYQLSAEDAFSVLQKNLAPIANTVLNISFDFQKNESTSREVRQYVYR